MATTMKSVVTDTRLYDWEGDAPLNRPWRETVVYEAHLAGMTRDPASGVPAELRGTYAGLIDKIPYLVDLGITAIELLPVFQFDRAGGAGRARRTTGATSRSRSSRRTPPTRASRARPRRSTSSATWSRRSTGPGWRSSSTSSTTTRQRAARTVRRFLPRPRQRRLLPARPEDRSKYVDFSGTGNTFKGNGPIVRRLILDSLRYWVEEMHVDGFRFDLAAVLSRGEDGQPLADPPIIWEIETDPVLAGTKLIAEAWDAGGLYQVGSFVGDRWVEWNGRFRDDVRGFVQGRSGQGPATSPSGSSAARTSTATSTATPRRASTS